MQCVYKGLTPFLRSLNLTENDLDQHASNRITALHASPCISRTLKCLHFDSADLLRTNAMLPHKKILGSDILHVIPNRSNLPGSTLQQEVTSRFRSVQCSASPVSDHQKISSPG